MEFNVIIEKDDEGWYVASVPQIQGCYTQGKTIQEVLERIKEAIEVCLKANFNGFFDSFQYFLYCFSLCITSLYLRNAGHIPSLIIFLYYNIKFHVILK